MRFRFSFTAPAYLDRQLEDISVVLENALDRLKTDIRALAQQGTAAGAPVTVDVASFKDRYGLTRKFAIPLLEWLDRERVTRRVGEKRLIIG